MFSMYLQGMYEYLINESQAQGKCNKRVVALQSKPIRHTHAHRVAMPSHLTQLPKVSLTLQIPENLICSRANSSQRGSP